MKCAALLLVALAGCKGGSAAVADAARSSDAAPSRDAAAVDLATPDLDNPKDLTPPLDASLAPPAAQLSGATTLLAELNVRDVSTDQGGGIWAVTSSTVYYFSPGKGNPFTYSQAQGLARGQSTWTDIYFSGPTPVVAPVTFTAVAGATSGQAIIGNEGAIADRLIVDPATGAVVQLDNMVVRPENSTPMEYPEHLKRVVATHSIVVDMNGTLNGTAYVGGWHGFSAFHGLKGDCGCMAFEEHMHYLPGPPAQANYCDDTPGDTSCWDGDVWGLAISPQGDVWAGDRHFVQLLPQRSLGPNAGLFDANFKVGIDVFPLARDEVHGLAVDGAGGLWVASATNGLAHFDPGLAQKRIWTTKEGLPENGLRGVAVDARGDVWVGTESQGLMRYRPAADSWVHYTAGSGLPGNQVNNVYFDKYGAGNRLLVAGGGGVLVYSGQ
jgi:hypothetical protein